MSWRSWCSRVIFTPATAHTELWIVANAREIMAETRFWSGPSSSAASAGSASASSASSSSSSWAAGFGTLSQKERLQTADGKGEASSSASSTAVRAWSVVRRLRPCLHATTAMAW